MLRTLAYRKLIQDKRRHFLQLMSRGTAKSAHYSLPCSARKQAISLKGLSFEDLYSQRRYRSWLYHLLSDSCAWRTRILFSLAQLIACRTGQRHILDTKLVQAVFFQLLQVKKRIMRTLCHTD